MRTKDEADDEVGEGGQGGETKEGRDDPSVELDGNGGDDGKDDGEGNADEKEVEGKEVLEIKGKGVSFVLCRELELGQTYDDER